MIDVIVPIFGRPDYTAFFLRALGATKAGRPLRPIIVDNGSDPETQRIISGWSGTQKSLEPPVVLRVKKNKGFAGAVNVALNNCNLSPTICIMHNDTVPFPGWLGEMSQCLDEADDKVAAIVPRTSYANEVSMCHPEIRHEFEKMKLPNKERASARKLQDIMDRLYPDGPLEVIEEGKADLPRTFYCSEIASFCMVTRRILLDGFDEAFFPRGFEDKLWFARLEQEGYRCEVANHAYVHHWGNITSDGPGFAFPDAYQRNEKLYRAKVRSMHDALARERRRVLERDPRIITEEVGTTNTGESP